MIDECRLNDTTEADLAVKWEKMNSYFMICDSTTDGVVVLWFDGENRKACRRS